MRVSPYKPAAGGLVSQLPARRRVPTPPGPARHATGGPGPGSAGGPSDRYRHTPAALMRMHVTQSGRAAARRLMPSRATGRRRPAPANGRRTRRWRLGSGRRAGWSGGGGADGRRQTWTAAAAPAAGTDGPSRRQTGQPGAGWPDGTRHKWALYAF